MIFKCKNRSGPYFTPLVPFLFVAMRNGDRRSSLIRGDLELVVTYATGTRQGQDRSQEYYIKGVGLNGNASMNIWCSPSYLSSIALQSCAYATRGTCQFKRSSAVLTGMSAMLNEGR